MNRWFVAVFLGITLASCSGGHGGQINVNVSPLYSAVGMDADTLQALTLRGDSVYRSCVLASAGVRIPDPVRPPGWAGRIVDGENGDLTVEAAMTSGYGIVAGTAATPSAPEVGTVEIDPGTDRTCLSEARAASQPSTELQGEFDRIQHIEEVRISQAPEVANAVARWSACIYESLGLDVTGMSQLPVAIATVASEALVQSGQNVAVATPDDPLLRDSPPTKNLVDQVRGILLSNVAAGEIRIATVDAKCRKDVYAADVRKVRSRIEQELIEANPDLIIRYRTELRRLLALDIHRVE